MLPTLAALLTPLLVGACVLVVMLLWAQMASSVTTETVGSRLFVRDYDHDPGATTAILASPDGGTTPWVWDMRDYLAAGVMVKPSIVGGNGITLVRVMAYSDAAATANATVVKTSGAIQNDDLSTSGGDQQWLEWTAEEVRHLGEIAAGGPIALRYIAIEITTSTNTDEAVVTFVGVPVFQYSGRTASLQA